MTEEILKLMDQRRNFKHDQSEYSEKTKIIKEKCKIAKEIWLNEQCEILKKEELHNSKLFYSTLKEIYGKKSTSRGHCIKDKNGRILMSQKEIEERWAEYVSELYAEPKRSNQNHESVQGSSILRSEVEAALREMKKGKAMGEDGIAVEMLLILGEFGINLLTNHLNRIYDKGEWPEELSKSVFIPLQKKPGATDCGQHRTICIMSQVTKILLRIMMKRFRNKIGPEIGREQYGFVKGKGTVNAIFALKSIMERSIEKANDLYLCFIDYSKAFDSVNHDEIFNMFRQIGIDSKDIRIVQNLYYNQMACVRVDSSNSRSFQIQKGVRQGCVMSPDFFNLYSESIFKSIDKSNGISINGEYVTNIRYADDAVLIANSPNNLQKMLDEVVMKSKEKGLLLNVKKTECMTVSKNPNKALTLDLKSGGEEIKKVDKFRYLGSMITDNAKDITTVKTQIAKAKATFGKLKPVLTNSKISKSTKMNIVKTFVYSVLLYGCETWTLNKDLERRLEAMEMWVFRRLYRISWTEKISNNTVLELTGMQRELLTNIRKRQMKFFGHIRRHESLEKVAVSGYIAGKRTPGRQRLTYLTSLRTATSEIESNNSYAREADDRDVWRSMIGNVLQEQATDK